ncbi:MAG: EpsG family protein [Dysgonamonadaceae bacterium]|jgi:hypothetical protein|nr:EpsG family protein [Dysgonamonadaceae bacterium]
MQWILQVFFILFIGLRMMGPDYPAYEEFYYTNESLKGTFELFFRYTIKIFRSIPLPFHAYLVFIATLSVSIKLYVIRRYSPYFYLSLLFAFVNYLLADMGQIRFSLAIATSWLALQYCEKEDFWRFATVCGIAATMHSSAWAFFPAYFIPSLRIKLPYMLLIWVGCLAVSYLLDNSALSDWVNDNMLTKDSMISSKVTTYTSDEDQTFTTRVKFSVFGLLTKILQLVLFTYATMENERLKSFFINSYFVGGCLFFFFSFSEIMSVRLSMYYFSFEVLSIPCFMYYVRDKITFWTLIGAFMVKLLYQFCTLIFVNTPMFYLPYKTILFPYW